MAKYDEFGREVPDTTPVEMPLGFKRPKPLQQIVREMIQREFSEQADAEGKETFDEANDFDVEDDDLPPSPHELLDDEHEFRLAEQEMLDRAGRDMENEKTLNNERIKESESGQRKGVDRARRSAEAEEVQSGGNAVDSESVGADGEERAASSGKGRAAGNRSGGVSKGG